MGAPAARAAELARHWCAAAHEVSILTGFPNHPTGVVPEEWKARLHRLTYNESLDGVNVHRTWLWPLPNRKSHERIRNYVSFCLSAALRGMSLSRPDVIIGTSPQLLVAVAARWLAGVKRVPFIFEVRDLWPESLTAVGIGSENSLLHRSLAAIASFLYRRSDHIVVVTPAFKRHLIERWHVPEGKISIVENGVETSLFTRCSADKTRSLRRELGLNGKFLVGYVGTLGMAHGLETLLEAASQLQKKNAVIHFLLIGEGAEKERIRNLAVSRSLGNVTFIDQQPRETIPALISTFDAALVLLRKTDVFKTVIPTKMLEFMSCACPVILGVEGQARQVLEEAKAGIAIEPENPAKLVEAIEKLVANPSLGRSWGQNGREYAVRNLSRQSTAERYIVILEQVLDASHAHRSAIAA